VLGQLGFANVLNHLICKNKQRSFRIHELRIIFKGKAKKKGGYTNVGLESTRKVFFGQNFWRVEDDLEVFQKFTNTSFPWGQVFQTPSTLESGLGDQYKGKSSSKGL